MAPVSLRFENKVGQYNHVMKSIHLRKPLILSFLMGRRLRCSRTVRDDMHDLQTVRRLASFMCVFIMAVRRGNYVRNQTVWKRLDHFIASVARNDFV